MRPAFPFSAIVGQEELKRALLLATVDASIGGVLIFGDRGTAKSTAVRGLAALLPQSMVVAGCRFGCDPDANGSRCDECHARIRDGETLRRSRAPVRIVDLPLGATEDRVLGALDLERVLTKGETAYEPGLLARAHRGFLYVDEINLLEDHIVDLLLDVAASGENIVEREGISVRHPAQFVLIGSGNPEEGELRPQLLDRFGLSVAVTTPSDVGERVEILRRRDAFDRDPHAFCENWAKAEAGIRRRIARARRRLEDVRVSDEFLHSAAELCTRAETDGLRGELTLVRAARAQAALDGAGSVTNDHLRVVARLALRHRLRRDPMADDADGGARVERALDSLSAAATA